MNYKGNLSSIERKVTFATERIFKKCDKLPTAQKILYLKKIIGDCDRIITLTEKLDDKCLDVSLLKKTEQNIDENLILFLEGLCKPLSNLSADKAGKQEKMPLVLRQPRARYTFSLTDGDKVCDIQIAFGGMKSFKESIKDKITVIEDVGKKEEMAGMNEIDRISLKTSMADIVRIFEAMKEAGIISLKTEVKQIAELFFGEVADKNSFEKKYNATKCRIKKEESASKSAELFQFIITVINKSYKGKGAEIERIIKYLETMQKNII